MERGSYLWLLSLLGTSMALVQPPLSPVSSKHGYPEYEAQVLSGSVSGVADRPPIDYTSFSGLSRSLWARFISIWTRRFTLSLIGGQVVSLCITCTNITTQELNGRGWSLPTTQTFFLQVTMSSPQSELITNTFSGIFRCS